MSNAKMHSNSNIGIFVIAVLGLSGCESPNTPMARAIPRSQAVSDAVEEVSSTEKTNLTAPAYESVFLATSEKALAPGWLRDEIRTLQKQGGRKVDVRTKQEITSVPGPKEKIETVVDSASPGKVAANEVKRTTQASFVPATADSSDSAFGGLIMALITVGTGLAVSFQMSGTAKLRRKLRSILADFEETEKKQKAIIGDALRMVEETAANYRKEIIDIRLSLIPTDEIRKVMPGVRLQPLQYAGISNLLQCQGWDRHRLASLRGIGPDSALKIDAAIRAITNAISSEKIRHPKLGDGNVTALRLFRESRIMFGINEALTTQSTALHSKIEELQQRISEILSKTSFVSWLTGFIGNQAHKAALELGAALERSAEPTGTLGKQLSDCRSRIVEVEKSSRGAIDVTSLRAHVNSNGTFYATLFTRFLGAAADPQHVEPTGATEPVTKKLPEPTNTPVQVRAGTRSPSGYTIKLEAGPASSGPKGKSKENGRWLPQGTDFTVDGFRVVGGMVYVGQKMRSASDDTIEPALIDPSLPIAADEADCTTRMLNYWSSYTYATPSARASYLQWLSTGKSNPSADIGYVFLYLYGLERRALCDALESDAAQSEIPAIVGEVRRLREIYGRNGSFNRYTGEFLDYVEFSRVQSRPEENEELPPLSQYHLSFALRHKLGRLAVSGNPLPPDWAYTWYYCDPRTRLLAPAFRCPDETSRLFQAEYAKKFGKGLILPASKTRLKLTYRPASPSFGGELSLSLELPDVGVLTSSYDKLESIGAECFRKLDGYSRFIGRNKTESKSFEGVMLLPTQLWPESQRSALEALKARAGEVCAMKAEDLLGKFGHRTGLNRTAYLGFCRALNTAGVGLEPDPRFGTDTPDVEDPVIVFQSENEEEPGDGFGLAALLLRLSATVAAADGDFSDKEAERIGKQVELDRKLSRGEKVRLMARLSLFQAKAPLLTGLKPTIASLGPEARHQITDFLVSLICSDREVQPSEVKVMEKIYGMFGLDAGSLYTRLHELSAGANSVTPARSPAKVAGPIRFDAARVNALRAASEENAKRLHVIFAEPDLETPPSEPEAVDEGINPQAKVLDLDDEHTALVVILIGRHEWTRSEFEELCADKGLMPDGALERINEAAFQKFDHPIIEGEDPLEIAVKLVEEALYGTDNTPQRS